MGLWHLGLVSAATLADLDYHVVGFDPNIELIENLKRGLPPLYEPGLENLLKTHLRTNRLRFEQDPVSATSGAKTVLITYDTPVNKEDCVDLSLLDQTIESICPHLTRDALVIINSQVPVGSCERWQKFIGKRRPDAMIDLIYSPENIRLGQAIELFRKPDMIVIGSNLERARKKAEAFYAPFSSDKFYVSWRTAEMAKHALNAFFATSISFANELGSLCDAVGADGIQIAQILKRDSRIGKKAQVRPGLGFAGATLARDLQCLQNVGRTLRVPTPLINSVLEINQRQIRRVAEMIESHFKGQLKNKILTVFGLTYKPGTSTLRRSASLEIMEMLHAKGAQIRAHDPKADLSELRNGLSFDYCKDPYEAIEGSHGILLLTEWPEYKDLDYTLIKKKMAHPLILDAKSHLESLRLPQMGFIYLEMGRGRQATVQT